MRRTFVVDDTVGNAPALGVALPVAAFASLMLGMAPFSFLVAIAAAGICVQAFRIAGWRVTRRRHRVTADRDSVTFASGEQIEEVERAGVERFSVETRGSSAVVLAHERDEPPRVVLTADAQNAPHLRQIVSRLEADGTDEPPAGGYRRAPDETHRRHDEVVVEQYPSGAKRRRAVAAAVLVLWTVLWGSAAAIFALDSPEIPWLAYGAAALGSLALAAIVESTLHDPSRAPVSRWRNLHLPRSPRAAWSLAALLGAGSLWSFYVVTRPLDVDANREGCDGGDANACWYMAHHLMRESRDAEALAYLEQACRRGHGRACSFRHNQMEQKSPRRARAMLTRGCELGDVTSCAALEHFLSRRGDEAGAKRAQARACELDSRRCETRR